MSWLQSSIVNRLRLAAGGYVTADTLAEVYEQFADGGALDTRKAVRVAIWQLRKKGFPIENVPGRGYRYAPELIRPAVLQGVRAFRDELRVAGSV